MKIGLFTATYLDMKLEEVCRMAAELGYRAVELPAFSGNPHLDLDEVLKGSNAKTLAKMISGHGLIVSALANHPEGQIVLGPYGKDTDAICKGIEGREDQVRHRAHDQDRPGGQRPGRAGGHGLRGLRELRALLPLALLQGLGGHGAGVRGALEPDPGQVRASTG